MLALVPMFLLKENRPDDSHVAILFSVFREIVLDSCLGLSLSWIKDASLKKKYVISTCNKNRIFLSLRVKQRHTQT